MRGLRSSALLGLALLAAGCVRYVEEWRFARDGSGEIVVTCEVPFDLPTQGADTSAAELFGTLMPPYVVLSQSCAQAGLELRQWSMRSRRGMTALALRITFPSLRAVARCPLFGERIVQWRASGRTATVMYEVNGRPWDVPEAAPETGVLASRPSSLEVRLRFPGRVLSARGAERNGRLAVFRTTLPALARQPRIAILVTARTRPPLWPWLLAVAMGLAATIAGVIAIARLHRSCKPSAPSSSSQV
mgnify:CR=1 FL=1|jgi:hypothetical protein